MHFCFNFNAFVKEKKYIYILICHHFKILNKQFLNVKILRISVFFSNFNECSVINLCMIFLLGYFDSLQTFYWQDAKCYNIQLCGPYRAQLEITYFKANHYHCTLGIVDPFSTQQSCKISYEC